MATRARCKALLRQTSFLNTNKNVKQKKYFLISSNRETVEDSWYFHLDFLAQFTLQYIRTQQTNNIMVQLRKTVATSLKKCKKYSRLELLSILSGAIGRVRPLIGLGSLRPRRASSGRKGDCQSGALRTFSEFRWSTPDKRVIPVLICDACVATTQLAPVRQSSVSWCYALPAHNLFP